MRALLVLLSLLVLGPAVAPAAPALFLTYVTSAAQGPLIVDSVSVVGTWRVSYAASGCGGHASGALHVQQEAGLAFAQVVCGGHNGSPPAILWEPGTYRVVGEIGGPNGENSRMGISLYGERVD